MPKLIKSIQHNLTVEQLNELKQRFDITEADIVDIKNLVPEEIYGYLVQTPGNEKLIFDTMRAFVKAVSSFVFNADDTVYLLLPIGSPALQYEIAIGISNLRNYIAEKKFSGETNAYLRVLFAHSERVVEEKKLDDGSVVKQSVFKHLRFLEL